MDGEEIVLSEHDAADLFESVLDDDGNLPGDTDYVEPTEAKDKDASPDADPDAEEVEDEPDAEDPEDDGDKEDDADEDEDDTPASTVDDETLVDIQIGEDTYEVNFAELKAGYLRNEELVNKTAALEQEHAERVAELEEKQAELAQELLMVTTMVTGDLTKYDKVNWDALKVQDPELYGKLRLEAVEAREHAQSLNERRKTLDALHNKSQELKRAAYLKSQNALAQQLIPDYKADPKGFFDKIVAYGATIGYTPEDIGAIADARQLVILNQARLQAESIVRKKAATEQKLVKDLPPVKKPGASKPSDSGKRKATNQAVGRMRSEKSVDAAAAYLMTLDL